MFRKPQLLHHTEQHREATPQESLESSLRTPTPNLRVAPPKVRRADRHADDAETPPKMRKGVNGSRDAPIDIA